MLRARSLLNFFWELMKRMIIANPLYFRHCAPPSRKLPLLRRPSRCRTPGMTVYCRVFDLRAGTQEVTPPSGRGSNERNRSDSELIPPGIPTNKPQIHPSELWWNPREFSQIFLPGFCKLNDFPPKFKQNAQQVSKPYRKEKGKRNKNR